MAISIEEENLKSINERWGEKRRSYSFYDPDINISGIAQIRTSYPDECVAINLFRSSSNDIRNLLRYMDGRSNSFGSSETLVCHSKYLSTLHPPRFKLGQPVRKRIADGGIVFALRSGTLDFDPTKGYLVELQDQNKGYIEVCWERELEAMTITHNCPEYFPTCPTDLPSINLNIYDEDYDPSSQINLQSKIEEIVLLTKLTFLKIKQDE